MQAGLHKLPRKTLLKKLEDSKLISNPEIRVLEFDDFIFHGIVLTIGLTISTFVFLVELIFFCVPLYNEQKKENIK